MISMACISMDTDGWDWRGLPAGWQRPPRALPKSLKQRCFEGMGHGKVGDIAHQGARLITLRALGHDGSTVTQSTLVRSERSTAWRGLCVSTWHDMQCHLDAELHSERWHEVAPQAQCQRESMLTEEKRRYGGWGTPKGARRPERSEGTQPPNFHHIIIPNNRGSLCL